MSDEIGTILVVDDTHASLKLLANILTSEGYRVRPADSGELALSSAAMNRPDLILLDIDMPAVGGFEVCRRLKADERFRDIPVIFISAHSDMQDKVLAFQAGGQDYITKPVQAEEVLARVRTHMRLRTLQAELELHNRQLERLVREQVDRVRESDARYQSVVLAMADGVVIQGRDGRVTAANPSAERFLGGTARDLLGRTLEDLLPGAVHEDGSPFLGHDRPSNIARRTGEPQSDVLMGLPDPGGTLRWVSVNSQPVRDAAEAGSSSVVTTFHDLTDRKRAEQELEFRNTLLTHQDQSSPDAILLVDDNTSILSCNHQFVELWDIPGDLVAPGRDEVELQAVLVARAADPDAARDRIRSLYDNREEKSLEECPLKDGRTIEIYTTPVIGANGRYFGRIWYFRDITERKKSEAAARQQQKLEAIGTLASGVAHEINNPLNVIMNYGQLLADHATDEVRIRDYSSSIVKECERVAVIVRNLLRFSRQDREPQGPARIGDIVEDTLSLTRALLRKDRIALSREIPDDLPMVRCRSQQIQQVLMNLLTNARDALNERYPKASEDKSIRVSATPVEKEGLRWVRLTVEDHGNGIPPDVASRVFEPFFTTKGKDKGTGLGLSISYGIVQEHEGTVWFESEPGRGTRFHVDLRVDR